METKERRKVKSIISRLLFLVKNTNPELYENSEEVEMAEEFVDELDLTERVRVKR